MRIDEGFWVRLVALSIAAACVIAVIVIAFRERRRTGRYPRELVSGFSESEWGWFHFLAFMLVWSRTYVPGGMIRRFPLCVLFPALDLAFLVGFAAVAVWALSYVFRATWHWRTGLWITFQLILPAFFVYAIVSDVVNLKSVSWAWIPAGFIAVLAAPFFARFAFQEVLARGQSEPSTSPAPDFRLWRPGEPLSPAL